jgi:hypothetical protein
MGYFDNSKALKHKKLKLKAMQQDMHAFHKVHAGVVLVS